VCVGLLLSDVTLTRSISVTTRVGGLIKIYTVARLHDAVCGETSCTGATRPYGATEPTVDGTS